MVGLPHVPQPFLCPAQAIMFCYVVLLTRSQGFQLAEAVFASCCSSKPVSARCHAIQHLGEASCVRRKLI